MKLADPEETSVAAPPERASQEAWPALEEGSTPETILAVALRKELEAVRYYEVLSRRGPLRTARVVFRRLCGEERRHVRWVRQWQADRAACGGAG